MLALLKRYGNELLTVLRAFMQCLYQALLEVIDHELGCIELLDHVIRLLLSAGYPDDFLLLIPKRSNHQSEYVQFSREVQLVGGLDILDDSTLGDQDGLASGLAFASANLPAVTPWIDGQGTISTGVEGTCNPQLSQGALELVEFQNLVKHEQQQVFVRTWQGRSSQRRYPICDYLGEGSEVEADDVFLDDIVQVFETGFLHILEASVPINSSWDGNRGSRTTFSPEVILLIFINGGDSLRMVVLGPIIFRQIVRVSVGAVSVRK